MMKKCEIRSARWFVCLLCFLPLVVGCGSTSNIVSANTVAAGPSANCSGVGDCVGELS